MWLEAVCVCGGVLVFIYAEPICIQKELLLTEPNIASMSGTQLDKKKYVHTDSFRGKFKLLEVLLYMYASMLCELHLYCLISFQYRSLTPIYYRGAAAAIVVYDITDERSFKDMKHWVNQLQKLAPYGIVLTLVGNKCDMEKNRQVSNEYLILNKLRKRQPTNNN